MSTKTDLAPKTFSPQTLDEAMNFAGMLAKSDMIPADYKGKPGNILAAVQMGAELGLHPMQAMQSIAVVNGRPTIWGDAALGLVEGSGLLEDITEEIEGEGDKAVARCTVKRRGRATPVSKTFSVEDAKRAGLWGRNTWKAYPDRMLQMRARGFALRDAFSDVLKGLYIREEAQDIPAEKEVHAEVVTHPAASRTEQVLQVLQAKHPAQVEAEKPQEAAGEDFALSGEPVPMPTFAEITDGMQEAKTLDELDSLADMAREFTDQDKAVLRDAYKAAKRRIGGVKENPLAAMAAAGGDLVGD